MLLLRNLPACGSCNRCLLGFSPAYATRLHRNAVSALYRFVMTQSTALLFILEVHAPLI